MYDVAASTTERHAANVYAAGGDASDLTYRGSTTLEQLLNGAWADDVFTFGDIKLSQYPIGMPGSDAVRGNVKQENLGLGRNSTLLNALYESKQITSHSYSWWWRKTGPIEKMDGSMVLGGYDRAKVSGENYTQSVATPKIACQSGLQVSISDLRLDFLNGTTASILQGPARKSIDACLEPHNPSVAMLQAPYITSFEELTGTHNVGSTEPTDLTDGLLYESQHT